MRSVVLAAFVLAAACSEAVPPDPGLEGLSITRVAPTTIIPGTKLVVTGASFVDDQYGTAVLRLKGSAGGRDVDVSWPAVFVDFETLTVAIDKPKLTAMGGDSTFRGVVSVEYRAQSDGEIYRTDEIGAQLEFREQLTPVVTGIQGDGIIFVNEAIAVMGQGFLLGGDEGQTVARVTGCFRRDGSSTCTPITPQEVPLTPTNPLERTEATFAFSPKIAGIQPGVFVGEVTVVNQQVEKAPVADAAVNVSYTMVEPQIFNVCVGDPCSSTNLVASLGQYVFIEGGGFVGGEAGHATELRLQGQFSANGGAANTVTLSLIPDFVAGKLVRYVLDTQDAIGQSIDLFNDTGSFTGTITPIISVGSTVVTGQTRPMSFQIGHVKQVVFLDYRPSYVEGLRDFGLRAVDDAVRQRILAVLGAAYQGVNIEFRASAPTDFALFMHVEITGRDPNNMGLFGYDNSPGKDVNNQRLYDRLGGVNAETQQDNYPGYGGVFLRSLMGFSKHPNGLASSVPGADAVFDQVFDPFRPDVGGEPVRAADLAGGVTAPTTGTSCPATSRPEQMKCAIWTIGNLVGGTMAHEIGHSLGLANPEGDGFHNFGDEPNRLMDSGGDRSFFERAELSGQGPGVFCDYEYEYLRRILPSSAAASTVSRPPCE